MKQDPKPGDRTCTTCDHAERLHHDDECEGTRPPDGSIGEWQCACEGFTDADPAVPTTGAK